MTFLICEPSRLGGIASVLSTCNEQTCEMILVSRSLCSSSLVLPQNPEIFDGIQSVDSRYPSIHGAWSLGVSWDGVGFDRIHPSVVAGLVCDSLLK
jgi:hypothetical protein